MKSNGASATHINIYICNGFYVKKKCDGLAPIDSTSIEYMANWLHYTHKVLFGNTFRTMKVKTER